LSDLGLTEEEADEILNKDEFLSNTSSDFDSIKKKDDRSMVEFEEISRNLLNSDLEPNHLLASGDKFNQISDKELDNLLSSGFNDLSDVSNFQVSETTEIKEGSQSEVVTVGGTELSKLSEFKEDPNSNSKQNKGDDSDIRSKIERAISIENSLISGNNTSELNVLMSEIEEFDTGNFLGGSDAVITSQGVLNSKENMESKMNEVIPEAGSDEDSDDSGDFIDRKSKVEKLKTSSMKEKQTNEENKSQNEKQKTEDPNEKDKQA
jgi:hypothetical protein